MSTYETDNKSGGQFGVIAIFFVAFMIVLGVAFMSLPKIKFTSHAKTSHVEQVKAINNCFNGGGKVSPFYMQQNGRYAQNCVDTSGNAYWRSMECENGKLLVITQFKQDLRAAADVVMQYISSQGFDYPARLKNYISNKGMQPVAQPSC